MRVRNSEHPLDNSAVHPERYKLVSKMAQKLKLEMKELVANDKAIQQLKMEDFNEVDAFTFEDIIAELKKPGRDPRQLAKIFEFDPRLKTINDVIVGMQLPGIVTNVAAFGAFVNIGIKENGLIHKSQMGENYVEDPTTVVRLHQHVISIVTELDVPRKRIGLKLIQA